AAISAVPRLNALRGEAFRSCARWNDFAAAAYCFFSYAVAPRALAAWQFDSVNQEMPTISSSTIIPHLDWRANRRGARRTRARAAIDSGRWESASGSGAAGRRAHSG